MYIKQFISLNRAAILLALFSFFKLAAVSGQNTALPVGSIPGAVDISPTGAATYSIPIEVAPGTQGVQPRLTISYNSQLGDGLLGRGWNLGGLSAIFREGQKLYADSDVTPVSLNAKDRFSLDGNRLVVTNGGDYGASGTTYGTEIETFVTVTSYGSISNNNCPEYFMIKTNDGATLEYGRTENSRFVPYRSSGNNTPFCWQLNKITDCNGNYMSYVYEKLTGESLIRYIRYTGNEQTGLATYNEIEFVYTDRNKNTVMVAGCEIRQTKKLSSVIVRCEDSLVRKYEFIYNEQDAVLQLKEVKLYGSDGTTVLNSTKMDWGTRGDLVQQTYLGANRFSLDYNIGSGDINGDGKTDILLYPKQLNAQSKWYVNLADGSGDFIKIFERNLYNSAYPFYNFHIADIDGDGKAEVLYYRCNNQVIYQEIWKYDNITGLFTCVNTISFPGKVPNVVSGDFDGDGIQEVLVFENDTKNLIYEYGFENVGNWSFYLNAKRCMSLDFDGDGKAELMLLSESGYDIYGYSNATGNFSLRYFSSDLTFLSDIQTGDFNGDGKTDFMVANRNSTWATYKLYYNKGNNTGFFSSVNLEFLEYLSDMSIPFILDLNGDGKDDFLLIDIYPITSNLYTNRFHAYYTKSSSLSPLSYEYEYETVDFHPPYGELLACNHPDYFPVIGDFHGDGRAGLLYRKGTTTNHAYTIRLSDNMGNFMTGITDGIGRETKIEYSHLSDMEVYTGTSQTYHCKLPSIRKLPLYVVKKLKINNGLGGLYAVSYNYENLSVNLRGKGILGFESVSVTDTLRKIISATKYMMPYTYDSRGIVTIYHQMPMLKESFQKSTVDNTILSRTENTLLGISLLNYGRCIPLVSESVSYNYLNDIKKVQNTAFDNLKYPVTVTTKIYQGIISSTLKKTETTTYAYTTTANSCRKVSQIQTKSRQGMIDTTYIKAYTYDSKGNALTESSSKQNIVLGKSTYTYTTHGAVSNKITEIPGIPAQTESYSYDTRYRFITGYTNPIGQLSYTQYDAKTGNVLTSIDINGLVTKHEYDLFGRKSKITFPDATEDVISMAWCTSSEAPNARYYVKIGSSVGYDFYCYYDLLGREVKKFTNQTYSDTRYTVQGQVEKISLPYTLKTQRDANKVWKTYTYDTYGRLASVTGPYLSKSYSYGVLSSTVTDNLKGVSYTQKTDVLGNIIEATDPGGSIMYKYNNENQPIEITSNGSTIKIMYDLLGNRIMLNDPDAGIITNTYDYSGQCTSQTDARGNTTTYQYDIVGRVTQKAYTEDGITKTVTYTYDEYSSVNKGKGRLSSVKLDGMLSEHFEYDELGRLKQENKWIDNEMYTHSYAYNSKGQLYMITYPGGFSVKRSYDVYGRLSAIYKSDNNLKIYEGAGRNNFGKITRCLFGNGLGSAYVYNDYGRIVQIRTGSKIKNLFSLSAEQDDDNVVIESQSDRSVNDPPVLQEEIYTIDSTIQNLRYEYNIRGEMVSRRDGISSQCERFTYDNIDRLTSHTIGACNSHANPLYYQYGSSGNLLYSPYVGDYRYENPDGKSHAVSNVDVISGSISPSECCVGYNAFNKPQSIQEGNYRLDLYYGTDMQRNKSIMRVGVSTVKTKYFVSSLYEKEVLAGNTRHLNYIHGDNGLIAIFVVDNANPSGKMYYIHQDHLGSYDVISTDSKTVQERHHFDPWGNRKNPANWSRSDTRMSFLFDRGFTGHEHLEQFKIINMNARLYDPVIGRFFSPDPYVQAPGSTQSFNRYSYCWNNPLKYTDPDGEFVHLIIGAAAGGILNWMTHGAEFSWKGLGYFGVGAAAGALSAGIGAGVSSAIVGQGFGAGFTGSAGLVHSSFFAGAASGLSAGATNGFITNFFNSALGNQNIKQSFIHGLNGAWKQGLSGAVVGGLFGGIEAAMDGRRFFDGATVNEETVATAKGLPAIQQKKGHHCAAASGEAIARSHGLDVTQESIAIEYQIPNEGANDRKFWNWYKDRYTFNKIAEGKVLDASTAIDALNDGGSIALSLQITDVKNNTESFHSVVLESVVKQTITKQTGRVITNYYYNVMNPISGSVMKNPDTIYHYFILYR